MSANRAIVVLVTDEDSQIHSGEVDESEIALLQQWAGQYENTQGCPDNFSEVSELLSRFEEHEGMFPCRERDLLFVIGIAL